MIKLLIPAILVLLMLAAIIYFIFKGGSEPGDSNQKIQSTQNTGIVPNLSEIKIEDLNIKEPPKPIFAQLFAPKQSSASGYVRLSEVTGKILIQLKSDDISDKIGFIYKGNCSAKGKIVYPLASLVDGKSQTIWETNLDSISKQLPLSVKVFKDAKNLNSYTRCADLKSP